jgi:hypothetical protein
VHHLKFVILQAILAAGLVALQINGKLTAPFLGDSKYFCFAVLAVWGYGMGCVFLQKWSSAAWIAAILVRIGIVGMIVGVIGAVAVVGTALSSSDLNQVLSGFLAHIGVALYASLVALASNLILETNIFFLGGEDNEDS